MSADPEIYFDCPNCKILLSVSKQQAGNKILCPKCGQKVDSPSTTSDNDWMLDGLTDQERQGDIPDSLKIDGISNDQDELAWDITCNVCDSTLLVNQQQVGTKIRCNDCHSLHEVQPPKEQQADDATTKAANSKSRREPAIDDDLMQLAPAIELPSEYKAAQTETLLRDIPDLDIEPQAAAAATVKPVTSFSSGAESDDDSDEMIELSDLPPEALNRNRDAAPPAAAERESDAPVRVFAKRSSKKKKEVEALVESIAPDAFADMSLGGIIDRSVRLLQSSAILIWAAGAILLLAFGGAFWHWIGPDRLDPETATIVSRIVQSGIAFLFGQGIFSVGLCRFNVRRRRYLSRNGTGADESRISFFGKHRRLSEHDVAVRIFHVHRRAPVADDGGDVCDDSHAVFRGGGLSVLCVDEPEPVYDYLRTSF